MTLALYGAGGLGREALELARQCAGAGGDFVFLDDTREAGECSGIPRLPLRELGAASARGVDFVVCVGEPALRKALFEKALAAGLRPATLVHPTVWVPASSSIGRGCIVDPGCHIGPDVRIGDNTAVLFESNVPHDCEVGDHCVLSANAILSGHCKVGEGAYVAAGAVVKEDVSIGSWSIVGMGSAVFRDVPDDVIALGNPARVVKNNENHRVFG